MGTDKLKTRYSKDYSDNYDRVFGSNNSSEPKTDFDKWYEGEYVTKFDSKPYNKMIIRKGWYGRDEECKKYQDRIKELEEGIELCHGYITGKKTDVPVQSTIKKLLKSIS